VESDDASRLTAWPGLPSPRPSEFGDKIRLVQFTRSGRSCTMRCTAAVRWSLSGQLQPSKVLLVPCMAGSELGLMLPW